MKRVIGAIALAVFPLSAVAQTLVPPVYVAASVAFGSVTGSYTQFLAGGKPLVDIDILNDSNQTIRCSFDAGTTGVEIPAYSSYSPDLGVTKKYITNAVQCKHEGVAPTAGTVEIFGWY